MKRFIVTAIWTAVVGSMAMAQPESGSVLTLSQCRTLALENNKQIAASRQATSSAVYTARSAHGNFLPDISASGAGMYNSKEGTIDMLGYGIDYEIGTLYSVGLTIEQPVYMGGKISAGYKMAKLGQAIAEKQETLTATEVVEATDCAYAGVVRATEMIRVAGAYNEMLNSLLTTVESAYRNGMKPKNDVLKVQVKVDESVLALRRAENALRLARMNLCHYIGLPLDSMVSVSEDFTQATDVSLISSPLPAIAAIENRPEYSMLSSQVDLAKQEIKLNRSELLPKVGVSASYNYVHGIEIGNRTLLDDGIFTAMVSVSLPLFHFGERSNKVRAAKAKMLQAELDREEGIESMTLELTQAANNVDEASLELTIAERSLTQAEENMRVSRSMYDAGMETLADHLEAQALWQQAWQTRVDAAYSLYLAHVAYQKASGTLLSE